MLARNVRRIDNFLRRQAEESGLDADRCYSKAAWRDIPDVSLVRRTDKIILPPDCLRFKFIATHFDILKEPAHKNEIVKQVMTMIRLSEIAVNASGDPFDDRFIYKAGRPPIWYGADKKTV